MLKLWMEADQIAHPGLNLKHSLAEEVSVQRYNHRSSGWNQARIKLERSLLLNRSNQPVRRPAGNTDGIMMISHHTLPECLVLRRQLVWESWTIIQHQRFLITNLSGIFLCGTTLEFCNQHHRIPEPWTTKCGCIQPNG